MLDPWLNEHNALTTVYGAVALAVWLGGVRPALLVAGLGYLVGDFVFQEPRGRFSFSNPELLVGMALYLVSCATIIAFGASMRVARRDLRASEELLRAKLNAMKRLHAVSERLPAATDLGALDDVLENAIATCAADFGHVQLLDADAEVLWIAAQRGFGRAFLEHFRTVRADDGAACARAMQRGERVEIHDVLDDPSYERDREIAAAAGYRSVVSVPLEARDSRLVGMLSVHFREPHTILDRDRRMLDLYGRLTVDLVERLRYERAFEDADRRKDEFLATLAHELRNPLAPIRNALQILEYKCPPDPELRWCHQVIDRQVGHMARLLEDLLDVSRITRDRLELQRSPVALASVLEDAIEASRPMLESGGHELVVALPNEAIELHVDAIRLAQVFSNLLNNAAKYTPDPSRIRLWVHREGDGVVVCVTDPGIGIAAEMLPRVFEMFAQAEPARSRSHGGLGIGLSLAKTVVELHGGTIAARSDGPGKGSEFAVCLPIASA